CGQVQKLIHAINSAACDVDEDLRACFGSHFDAILLAACCLLRLRNGADYRRKKTSRAAGF
ncbi:hypothetical protein, partial [Klebsiella pneumoniae]|uniref:hypothetical protein n=1 Tax=Klebsiella pneumoniae TaxID=573 RepID=UPI001C205A91